MLAIKSLTNWKRLIPLRNDATLLLGKLGNHGTYHELPSRVNNFHHRRSLRHAKAPNNVSDTEAFSASAIFTWNSSSCSASCTSTGGAKMWGTWKWP